jgi:ankyrin repeat protein
LNINSARDLKFRLYIALLRKDIDIAFLKKLFSKFKSSKDGRFGDYINEKDFVGNLPLFSAISSGNVELVKLLLDNGADLNVQNKYGESPLHKACSGGHASIVKLLLEKGVGLNAQDKYGESPLHKACFSGYYNIVKLLLEKGVDPNVQDKDGESPLHKARSKGHDGIAKLLLEHGAKSDLKDKDDKKPTGRVFPCSDGGKPFNHKKAFWLGVAAILAAVVSIALISGVADAYIGEVWCFVLAVVIAVIALCCAYCAKTQPPPSGPSTEFTEARAGGLNSQKSLGGA